MTRRAGIGEVSGTTLLNNVCGVNAYNINRALQEQGSTFLTMDRDVRDIR